MKNKIRETMIDILRVLHDKVDDLEAVFYRWKKFFMFFTALLLAGLITIISTTSFNIVPEYLEEGMVASSDIKADRSYEIVDQTATQKLKEEAMKNAPKIYLWRSAEVLKKQSSILTNAFNSARDVLNKNRAQKNAGDLAFEEFSKIIGFKLDKDFKNDLINKRFSSQLEGMSGIVLSRFLSKPVAEEKDVDSKRFIIKDVETAGVTELMSITTVNEVREQIKGIKNYASVSLAIASNLIVPNCFLDEVATNVAQNEAAALAKSVIINLKPGEMIVRHGARFTTQQIMIINSIQSEKQRGGLWLETFGIFLYSFLAILIPFSLGRKFFIRFRWELRDYFLLMGVGLVSFLGLRIGVSFIPILESYLVFPVPAQALNYIIPIASASMLLRIFLPPKIVLLFAISISSCSTVFPGVDVNYSVFVLLTSLSAVIFTSKAGHRASIIRAGFLIGIVGAVAVLSIKFMSSMTTLRSIAYSELIWYVMFAFLSGVISSAFVLVVTPLVEHLTGYASDMKLLELANLNHPLLRELIVRAPGTYHHSHLVGVLGEAAAEAIGANALLVRVAAYYHDIGKMKKPQYFVENTMGVEDRHQKLSPQMSALILLAHMKDGQEMAQKAGLPRIIVSLVAQHHGTRLMKFFYDKACNLKEEGKEVDEREFRYPGPKPRSREAAILLLADVTEAMSRSMKDKSPATIEQMVKRAISDIFLESQLDNCALTLRDLTIIGDAFVRVLLGIYHQRIEYPKDESQNDRPSITD